ncbi:transglycosylase SLT domain-containing protein [Flavihumibacter solisilvae]|uniref:transglycosylase SLT domain-containing protein n=1 Tax=Flavihumibacter solisilvae TaxID=1349421 RepID=UPI000B0CE713|nr:transporter substrate-binding domain-containing protein [Flavihumibacter solisilvae]
MNSGNIILRNYLLLLLLIVSCKEAGRNKADSNTGSAVVDTGQAENASEYILKDSTTGVITGRFIEALRRAHRLYVGDFDTMMKLRVIRVLVPYSRTLFFNDKGYERGITADNFHEFEGFLNKKYEKELGRIPLTVVFVQTPRNRLFEYVMRGVGDIAAGNLTATTERLKQVDFMVPDDKRTSEIVLNRKGEPAIPNAAGLSGNTVYVRRSSSYFSSLKKLNATLAAEGKAPVNLEIISDNLEDEDLMEMLNAGIISTIVVDDWKAKMWAKILPKIRVNETAAVRAGATHGVAYRKESPGLARELEDYYHYQQRRGTISDRLKQYGRMVGDLQDPTRPGNVNRFTQVISLFRKYGQQYDFDPLMLAALGFQESKLDHNLRSRTGEVGVMQLKPGTGKAMKVGDIRAIEPNIHAGTKYIATMMEEYFKDAHFDDFNRCLFAFASYNAGPGQIAGLRKTAADQGLDPDVWLNNVEIIASEKVGQETTTYVRNIIKYYYAYKLMKSNAAFTPITSK